MKLIDKDKIVAEMEEAIDGPAPLHDQQCSWENGYYCGLYKAESIIDTLEVKEVDLAKEIDKFYGMYRKNGITFSIEDNQECLDWKEDCNPDFEIGFARHFFELGMRVSNKV